jgi:hypothetical protein
LFSTAFIVCGLIFPRLTLLICSMSLTLPLGVSVLTPLVADILGAIFIPRLLIAFWAFMLGLNPFIVALFGIFGVLELFGGGSASRR